MIQEEAVKTIYDFLAVHAEPKAADAVIAFGRYHEPVAVTAAHLVLDGFAPIMVCTGATTELTQDVVGSSEAEFFANIARREGLRDDQLLIEPNATNTGANVELSFKLLREHGIEAKTVLTTAMPAHQMRIIHTIARQEPQIEVVPVLVPFQQSAYRTRTGKSYPHRLVAELERLRVYPEQGFTTAVDFPQEVLEAEAFLQAHTD